MEGKIKPLDCPVCGSHTGVGVLENTVLLNFPLYCSACRREHIINYIRGILDIRESFQSNRGESSDND